MVCTLADLAQQLTQYGAPFVIRQSDSSFRGCLLCIDTSSLMPQFELSCGPVLRLSKQCHVSMASSNAAAIWQRAAPLTLPPSSEAPCSEWLWAIANLSDAPTHGPVVSAGSTPLATSWTNTIWFQVTLSALTIKMIMPSLTSSFRRDPSTADVRSHTSLRSVHPLRSGGERILSAESLRHWCHIK